MKNEEKNSLSFDPNKRIEVIPGFTLQGDVETQPMRAYLAGPLTGLSPNESNVCCTIRDIAKDVIGKYFDVYDPGDYTSPETEHTADEVYLIDHANTSTADLVVFHVCKASLGVGIESQIAAEATIPKVVVYPAEKNVSRMFRGVFSPTIADIEYENTDDFRDKLEGKLHEIYEKARTSSERRKPIKQLILNGHVGRAVMKARILRKMSISTLEEHTDIRKFFLKELEYNDEVAMCLSITQLQRIGIALDTTIFLSKGILEFNHGETLDENQQNSLENLVSWVREREQNVPDSHIIELWGEYLDENSINEGMELLKARDKPDYQLLNKDEWENRYNKKFGLGLD